MFCTPTSFIYANIAITSTAVWRPLPPLPNLEVFDVVIEKAAGQALVWVNKVLAVAHDIAIKRDMTVFIQVSLSRTRNLFVMHVSYTCTHKLLSILYLMHVSRFL